ncbi:MAG: VOC family protein, partial [Cyanobacteria bacterium J06639_18]
MQLELDHIFVCVKPLAPEAEILKAFGLTEGRRRIHRGQGTANVCFFFHNVYLELLWLSDSEEIQSDIIRPLGLWERCRWKETNACPFGIAFRKKIPDSPSLPFSTWGYHAPYIPPEASIPIASNSRNLSEPLIFISPSTQKPINILLEKRPPLINTLQLDEITGLRVTLPGDASGDSLRAYRNFSPEIGTLIE